VKRAESDRFSLLNMKLLFRTTLIQMEVAFEQEYVRRIVIVDHHFEFDLKTMKQRLKCIDL
jgi:hypothetical protein